MSWDSALIGGTGTIGSLLLANQAAHGTLDLPATLGALTALVTAFSIAAAKIWSVMVGVNARLQQLADDAQARRKAAEEDNESLRREIARLRDEVEALREQLEQRQDEHETAVETLEDTIEELESRLIATTRERDQYQQLWRQANPGSETPTGD